MYLRHQEEKKGTRFHISLIRVDVLLLTHTSTAVKQIIQIHQTVIMLKVNSNLPRIKVHTESSLNKIIIFQKNKLIYIKVLVSMMK